MQALAAPVAALASRAHVARRPEGLQASNGTVATTTCLKKDIHPKFYKDAKIFCNGVEVMSCGGTKAEYIVDVWSGNHPFYQGNKTTMVVEDGRVNRFNKMYAELSDTLGNVATINGGGDGGAGAPASAKPAKAAPAQAKAAGKAKK